MPYTPHDWSPGTWALMLLFMIVFVMGIALTYLFLVHRACQTTGGHLTKEEISPELASRARVPAQSTGVTHDAPTPAPL